MFDIQTQMTSMYPMNFHALSETANYGLLKFQNYKTLAMKANVIVFIHFDPKSDTNCADPFFNTPPRATLKHMVEAVTAWG